MGLSSLAVMGNSLTLQLHGRPARLSSRAETPAASLPQNAHMQQSLPQQHHHADAAGAKS